MFEIMPFDQRMRSIFSPFAELENLEHEFFRNPTISSFRTDISDKGDSFVLEADLPGFRREDIDIDINGKYMTIKAIRNEEHEEKDEGNHYLRRERSFGSFSRCFEISAIDSDKITADYENGVLSITMPKKEITSGSKSRRLQLGESIH